MKLSIKHIKAFVAASMSVAVLAVLLMFNSNSRAASVAAGDGAATFKAKCIACHGADGSGNTAAGKSLKARDLRSADVQKQSDDQLFNIISKGKGKMPAYEKTLGADACRELVAYVRRLGGK